MPESGLKLGDVACALRLVTPPASGSALLELSPFQESAAPWLEFQGLGVHLQSNLDRLRGGRPSGGPGSPVMAGMD